MVVALLDWLNRTPRSASVCGSGTYLFYQIRLLNTILSDKIVFRFVLLNPISVLLSEEEKNIFIYTRNIVKIDLANKKIKKFKYVKVAAYLILFLQ